MFTVTWWFQKSLPPLFVRIFVTDLTLYRLQWPAATSRQQHLKILAASGLHSKASAQATLPRKPFQDYYPSTSFLISGSNYFLQLLVKSLGFSVGCSQTSWVMGGRKRAATADQKVRGRKVPALGTSPADGLAAQGKCLFKVKVTRLSPQSQWQWNFRFCVW